MSVINPNETAKNWQASKREPAVQLYLSGVEGDSAELVGTRVAGFPLSLNIVPVTDWIDPAELAGAVVGDHPGRCSTAGIDQALPEARRARSRRR